MFAFAPLPVVVVVVVVVVAVVVVVVTVDPSNHLGWRFTKSIGAKMFLSTSKIS